MRVWPYEYRDRDADGLTICPADGDEDSAELQTAGKPWVPSDRLPEVIAALYEAVGLPVPVILERPATPNLEVIPGLRFSVRGRGIEVERPGRGIEVERPGCGWHVDPGVIRELAASLAMLADEAESEPDPEEVAELAARIRSELYPDSDRIGLRPSEADRAAARIALRWMREREAAS